MIFKRKDAMEKPVQDNIITKSDDYSPSAPNMSEEQNLTEDSDVHRPGELSAVKLYLQNLQCHRKRKRHHGMI